MKTVFLTSLLSTLLSNNIPTTPIRQLDKLPEKCPSVLSISSQGLDYVVPFIPGRAWDGLKQNSHYDTNDTWTFLFMATSDAKNARVAIQQLSEKLSSFHPALGPQWDEEMGIASCEYKTDSDDWAVTFSPSLYE